MELSTINEVAEQPVEASNGQSHSRHVFPVDRKVLPEPLMLDIGCGEKGPQPGFIGVDRKFGGEAYPLRLNDGTVVADNSVDELRASHVLEHFGHNEVGNVVQEWVRALKQGGTLKIAVPDFSWIARAHIQKKQVPYWAYLWGGQSNPDDFHKCGFSRETLSSLMRQCGLRRVREWYSSIENDGSSLPVSLNLEGTKGLTATFKHPMPKVHAIVTLPRLAFTSNMFCSLGTAQLLGIPFRKLEGAYWEQCIERCITDLLDDVPDLDYVMTMDYDSVFRPQDVATLIDLAVEHPEADAIAPVQVRRASGGIMAWLMGPDGKPIPTDTNLTKDHYKGDLLRAYTAHFGLTLLKAEKFKKLPRPWFRSIPDARGEWGPAHIDADIAFWQQWHSAGNTLYLAPRVPIGHTQVVVSWPNDSFGVTHQACELFWEEDEPADLWT